MKRKILSTITGSVIFVFCFVSAVLIRDYFYEQKLRTNIHKVRVGMTDKKVIGILGKPSLMMMSDIPGEYWCYDTNSIARTLEEQAEISCGHLLLEISADGKVVKVFDFN